MLTLFAGLENETAATALDPARLSGLDTATDRTDPDWPLATFLVAELHRLRGDAEQALALHRELALWAADDAYGDSWGGSGLAIFSLWRWQQALAGQEAPEQAALIEPLAAGERLIEQRLVTGMFKNAFFDALPQLEEEVRRAWPKFAWSAGNQLGALRLFVEFLRAGGAAELDAQEEKLLEEVSKADMISRDWLLVLRGQRLIALRRHGAARNLLEQAFRSENPEVRAEAGLSLSGAIRATESNPIRKQEAVVGEVIADAVDPYVAQKALLKRGYLYKRAGRDREMLADFTALVEAYPAGPFSDDALVELARYHQNKGNVDQALALFSRLQAFPGENDWADTAVYQPAIALYTRGGPGDLERAYAMLQSYEERAAAGPVRRVALFWLGRIAEELGIAADSEGYFRQTIAEMPYDYYALRARMHLNAGADARRLIEPDPATEKALAGEFATGRLEEILEGTSPYLQRVAKARDSGLYAAALAARDRFHSAFPGQRAAAIPLAELDRSGYLAQLAVLMALRQDALAAKDVRPTSQRRLRVAGALMRTGDTAFAIQVATAGGEHYDWRSEAQQDLNFLATAYPTVFGDVFQDAARAHDLPAAFLYSVARRESSLDPHAVSSSGAVGLFQFSEPAFQEMDSGNRLKWPAHVKTRQEYLVDPERSIRLGADWFGEKKLPANGDNLVLAVMAHHAGNSAVRNWQRDWKAMGRDDDIEFMIETARSRHTRYLTRRVLTDYAIVRAAGLFNPP